MLRLHSVNAPNDARLSAKIEGFSDADIDGRRWRVFSGWDADHRYLVQVGERREARDEIVAKIAKNLSWPLAVALPALGLLIWLGIDRALHPLRVIGRQVEHRAPDNLAALEAADVPSEVAPLVDSLNRLFGRVRSSIENERRFTADAAHELRTPLAALRAQAQVARTAADDAQRARALDNVIAGCDRASHLVEQLLTLARLEPEGLRSQEPCELRELAQLAVADIVPAAHAKSIDVDLEADGAVTIPGDARLLRILLRNLLDNAVRYSPPRTAVHVRVEARGGGGSDNGRRRRSGRARGGGGTARPALPPPAGSRGHGFGSRDFDRAAHRGGARRTIAVQRHLDDRRPHCDARFSSTRVSAALGKPPPSGLDGRGEVATHSAAIAGVRHATWPVAASTLRRAIAPEGSATSTS